MRALPYFLLIIPLLLGVWFSVKKRSVSYKTISYKLENKMYKLRTAKTYPEWEQGLMFVTKPVDYDGMIFSFPDREYRTFWNKNTLTDLTVYWLSDDRIVSKEILPAITKSKGVVTLSSPEKVNKVIEIIR